MKPPIKHTDPPFKPDPPKVVHEEPKPKPHDEAKVMYREVIQPIATVGLIVWYWVKQPTAQTQPMAAIISSVIDAAHVNLTVFNSDGSTHAEHGILLVQQGDPTPHENHCEWPERPARNK